MSEVRVAVPLALEASAYAPYADGQRNAAASFAHWAESRPPLVATLRFGAGGEGVLFLRLDRALPAPSALTLSAPGGELPDAELPLEVDARGFLGAELPLDPAALESLAAGAPLFVRPAGWSDVFPLSFRHPAQPASFLVATMPEALRTFPGGRPVVDPLGIAGASDAPARLEAEAPSAGYSGPFRTENVHAEVPSGSATITTGVGGARTWVAEPPASPFKTMYACFDGRLPEAEALAPSGGVPSGSGFHLIGDPAETIVNALGSAPLLVAFAEEAPAGVAPPSGAFAYGLHAVAVARWLLPGEAMTTPSGEGAGRANFHAFYFHERGPVCAELWVHPCRPESDLRFGCD